MDYVWVCRYAMKVGGMLHRLPKISRPPSIVKIAEFNQSFRGCKSQITTKDHPQFHDHR
jgi:hypothetical protein